MLRNMINRNHWFSALRHTLIRNLRKKHIIIWCYFDLIIFLRILPHSNKDLTHITFIFNYWELATQNN